jgi:phosphoribosylanthranilate isomerase
VSGTRLKVCGLSTPEAVEAAVAAGAAYVGFVFHPASPRHVSPAEARALALLVPPGVAKVALVVDPSDAALDAILDVVPVDMIQLHGRETPERVAEVRASRGLPVMKAMGVAVAEDLLRLDAFGAADQILLDAKAPPGGLPGGNGLSFDWSLLAGRRWARPWMLAGGLNAANVAEAVRLTGARQVDVSSGVESAPGIKDASRIRAFAEALR